MPDRVFEKASKLQAALSKKGAHRSAGVVDLLTAVTAETHGYTLLHYDRDFVRVAEVIRKGKAAKPTEFGKLLKLKEAENQIIIAYEVYPQRPHDADLLIPAIEIHAAKLGRVPRLVAADAGFYSGQNQATANAKGVRRVCIPHHGTKTTSRKLEQKKRCSAMGSDGVPDARDASASASVGMDFNVAATVATMACDAGSDAESSLTTSSTPADSSLPSAA